MSDVATVSDTWGIPGPTFLIGYLAAAAFLILVAVIHRRRLFRGDSGSRRDLGPVQAAYLNGGPSLAVYTALGGLRTAGAVGIGPGGGLAQTGPMPAGATPLDQAVYHAAGQRLRVKALLGDAWVDSAIAQLREGLERHGLALDPAQRTRARLLPLALLALLALGVARVVAGIANGRPVLFLILAMVAVGVIAVVMLVRAPRQTRAARDALAAMRVRHAHLSPAHQPAYATYGMAGAAMGVALFGAGALWTMDPAFAAEAELERHTAAAGGSGAYNATGGDGGGGGGNSDGGGGGSCGGGGGCGGGGCGG